MEFHEKLRQLRKGKGMTQEALAQSLYVSRTAVSKWESGRGYPSIDSIKQISVFFDVPIDALLSSEDQNLPQRTRILPERFLFGLTDISGVLLLLLPLFRQKLADGVAAESLLRLSVAPYLQAAYWVAVIWFGIFGVLYLALPDRWPFWQRHRRKLSLLTSAAGLILFVISLQPYAALYLLICLSVKVVCLLKKP